jgi:two-component system, chemotaxis family, response regulator Rcp1
MNATVSPRPVDVLLVEDSPADVRLTREVLRDARVSNELRVVGDGQEALAYLRGQGVHAGRALPDLILLDLNLPRMDGRQVLAEIDRDPLLCQIPIVVLTTSASERDVIAAYAMRVAAYVTKPVDLDEFIQVVRSIEGFWLSIVTFRSR